MSWLLQKHNYWFLGDYKEDQVGIQMNQGSCWLVIWGHSVSGCQWRNGRDHFQSFCDALQTSTVQESYSITKSQGRKLTTVCFACSLEVCWCLLVVIFAGYWNSQRLCPHYVPTSAWEQRQSSVFALSKSLPIDLGRDGNRTCLSSL